jgi:hypothetical protein
MEEREQFCMAQLSAGEELFVKGKVKKEVERLCLDICILNEARGRQFQKLSRARLWSVFTNIHNVFMFLFVIVT